MDEYGEFSKDGKEYVIKGHNIPRKWDNFLWNDTFLCNINHDGTGVSFFKHDNGLRTELFKEKRSVYIRNNASGDYWHLPNNSVGENTIHGIGYTIFNAEKQDIEASLRITVPQDIKGEAWKITVKNKSDCNKKLSIFSYANIDLTGYPSPFGYNWSYKANFSEDYNGIIYINNDSYRPTTNYNGYICSDTKIMSFEMVEDKFIGSERGIGNPLAVETGKCESTVFAGGDVKLGVLQFDIELEPGSIKEIQIINGIFEEKSEVEKAIKQYLS